MNNTSPVMPHKVGGVHVDGHTPHARQIPSGRIRAPNGTTVDQAVTITRTNPGDGILRKQGSSWSVGGGGGVKGAFPIGWIVFGGAISAGFEANAVIGDENFPAIFGQNGTKKDIQLYKLGAGILRGAITGTLGTVIFLGVSVGAAPTLTPVGSGIVGFAAAYRASSDANKLLLYIQDGIERGIFSTAVKKEEATLAKKAAPGLILHLHSMAAAQRKFVQITMLNFDKADKLISNKAIKLGDTKSNEIEILQKILKSAGFYDGGVAKKDIYKIFGEGIFSDTSWDQFFKNPNEDILFFKDDANKESIVKKIKDPKKRKNMLEFLDRARRNPVTGILDNDTLKILSEILQEPVKKIDAAILVKLRERFRLTLSIAEAADSEAKTLGVQYNIQYPPQRK